MNTIFAIFAGIGTIVAVSSLVWKTIVKPGAKAIAEREIREPILAEITRLNPPLVAQLASIDKRLSTIEDRLGIEDDR